MRKLTNGFESERAGSYTADNSGIDDFCKNAKNGQLSDFTIFANFDPELYMLWSFGKATV